jgi:zinc protease
MLSVNAKSLKTDLPLVIQLMAEQLRTPLLSEEELAKTKTQLEGSIRQSSEDPEARAREAFSQAVFPVGHPSRPSSSQERLAALKQLTLDDVKAFHRDYYGPANLTLVFVGDVDPQAIRAEVQKAFAGWTGGVVANRSANAAKARSTPDQTIVLQDKASVAVVLGQATGLRYQDADSLALRVGTAILGNGFTGRLMASVRDAEGLTYGIGAHVADDTFLDGDVAISATFAPQLLAKGITSTRREIRKWWQDGVTAQELTARKTNMIGAYEVGLATTGGVARAILETLNRGKNLSWLDEYPKAIQALTQAQVNGAIRKYVDPEKMVLVKAGTLP